MFDTVCTLPLTAELFSQTIHPSEPLLATGLATGHVSVYRLPPDTSSASDDDEELDGGRGHIDTIWRTRRHGPGASCRALAFTPDGESLVSAGADGVVKYASSLTGRVVDKILVPAEDELDAAPCLLHALSGQTVVLATDGGAMHVYDLREGGKGGFKGRRPAQTHRPHADHVTSLTPLPPTAQSTSGVAKQWVSTGGTTLAVTDLRRGVLVRSADQDEVLLSSACATGLSARGTSTGTKIATGGGDGVISLWERGQWDDLDERVVVDPQLQESVDALLFLSTPDPTLAVGLGDGRVRFVHLGPNKVVGQVRHHDVEPVVALDVDVEGRLITGGGDIVKVWHHRRGEVDQNAYVPKGQAPGKKLSIYDDDSDEGSGDDEPQRKKVKGQGGHLNGKAGNFSFDGLD
ncbi:hypothetical protein ANO11243_027710 [Dothideomycetidae sp. 11243]|nr:hypothetical protein ANO11243_027710 [fungal sp. No.11243]